MSKVNFSEEEIRDGAPFAALSYILIFWIVVFIFRHDNGFARLHARQGIVISVAMLGSLAFMPVPYIGTLCGILALVLVVASLYGIFLSLTGRTDRIYLISNIAEKLVV